MATKYIISQIVDAEPCTVKEYNKIRSLYYTGECQDGYKITYPDGKFEWIPKDYFEKNFHKIEV